MKVDPELDHCRAALRDALETIARYRKSLLAHHEISTLSQSALAESLGGPCRICARAQGE